MHKNKTQYIRIKKLRLKWSRGAESTLNVIKFQKNTELTKNE